MDVSYNDRTWQAGWATSRTWCPWVPVHELRLFDLVVGTIVEIVAAYYATAAAAPCSTQLRRAASASPTKIQNRCENVMVLWAAAYQPHWTAWNVWQFAMRQKTAVSWLLDDCQLAVIPRVLTVSAWLDLYPEAKLEVSAAQAEICPSKTSVYTHHIFISLAANTLFPVPCAPVLYHQCQ